MPSQSLRGRAEIEMGAAWRRCEAPLTLTVPICEHATQRASSERFPKHPPALAGLSVAQSLDSRLGVGRAGMRAVPLLRWALCWNGRGQVCPGLWLVCSDRTGPRRVSVAASHSFFHKDFFEYM